MRIALIGLITVLLGIGTVSSVQGGDVVLHEDLKEFVAQRVAEFDQIPADRKLQLKKIAQFVQSREAAGQPVKLTFICTHNSRRSHMSQIWAAVAAAHFGVDGVHTFSGGTENTAFNPRAVAALERAGLAIEAEDESENPKYRVSFAEGVEPLVCFSKVYSMAPNPSEDFCAVMTCSHADDNCPTVSGAVTRLAIPYEDPKVADGTPGEAAKYDERCAQIARELLYAFSQVK
jgi:arsenate reductase